MKKYLYLLVPCLMNSAYAMDESEVNCEKAIPAALNNVEQTVQGRMKVLSGPHFDLNKAIYNGNHYLHYQIQLKNTQSGQVRTEIHDCVFNHKNSQVIFIQKSQ